MANFCPNCGEKVNPDDKFCKSCGANLAGVAEAPKEEVKPAKPPTFIPAPVKPKGAGLVQSIANFIGALIGIGIIILILYSLGCAMGVFSDTQDQMCQSIQQAFKSGGGTPTYGAPCTINGETGLYGTDGKCYTCSVGAPVTSPINETCSNPIAGVYCCRSGTSGSGGTSGGGGTQVSIGCKYCSPGTCWTGQACCPKYAPYYCKGGCFPSSGDAYSAGCHQSTWKYWCCQ